MSELEGIVERDHEVKKRLQEKERRYYEDKIGELALQRIARFVQYHPNPSKRMREDITFAYRDLGAVAQAMANKEPWTVISGLNPSGPLHFGHKVVFDELLWMQEQGANIHIPITTEESYLVGKVGSLKEAREIAYDEVIPSIIAMGFDPDKTRIYVDSDYPDIYNVAMDVARHVTLSKARGVFGFTPERDNPGTVFYRAGVQLAQMLLPQYEEFGGPQPTLVTVGMDQYPYLLLARDVAAKKGYIPPAGVFLKFLWGLDGKGKMSASRQGSALFLTETPKRAEKMVKRSYTGGSPSADFQRQNGGIPEICPVYTLRTYHFDDSKEVASDCKTAVTLCGGCKVTAGQQVRQYLVEHQAKREEAKQRIGEYMLTTPVRSIFK